MLVGLLAPSALGNQRHPFTDVNQNAPYNNAVQFLWERGIMVGTSDTQFSPNATLTRAMLATIVYRVAGEPQTAFRSVFSDVPSGRWYSVPVTWANDAGIVQGVGGGRFAPDDRLTREQLAAMMHRYAVSRGDNVSVPANVTAPAGTSGWATNYVRWAIHNGFISTSNPSAHASRAETANFVYRFMNQGTTPPTGNIDTLTRNGATFRDLERQGFSRREIQGAFERELIRLVNNYRATHGLWAFTANDTLGNVARLRAEESLVNHSFTHVSETTGLEHTAHFNQITGLRIEFAGENLSGGQITPQGALDAWLRSPPHRYPIMTGAPGVSWDRLTRIGAGFDFGENQPDWDNHTRFALWFSTADY